MGLKDTLNTIGMMPYHVKDRVIEVLGGLTEQAADKRASENYAQGYHDGNDDPVEGTVKSQGYRRTIAAGLRDFTKVPREKLLEVVWSLYQSNPVAKRTLDIKAAYLIGGGVQRQTEDEDLQEILDNFWKLNKLDLQLVKFVRQLFLWGEQIYPAFVREADGRVKLGYIDPSLIVPTDGGIVTHPENALEQWAVIIGKKYGKKAAYRVIREDEGFAADDHIVQPKYEGLLVTAEQAMIQPWETKLLAKHGLDKYTGSCFLYNVNNVSNQPRGFSDLLQVADWLDQLDETLFALGEREQMAGYFFADVTLTGANKDTVDTRANELRAHPPKKGSVNVHNENEAWDMTHPDLKQDPSIATANEQLTFVLGGLGLPRHWYGHGDETNRATAQAQGDPTWRTLKMCQDYVKHMIVQMLTFARDQAAIAGAYSGEDEITVTMPEMTVKDMMVVSQAMAQLALALTTAESSGWIDHETAAEAWAKAMAELGIEYDLAEMLEMMLAEEEPVPLPAALESWFTGHEAFGGEYQARVAEAQARNVEAGYLGAERPGQNSSDRAIAALMLQAIEEEEQVGCNQSE